MNQVRVCVAGATGWVGRALVPAIIQSSDLSLVGAVSRSNSGKELGTVLDIKGLSVKIASSVEKALEVPTDVLIDYTSTDSVKGNVLVALEKGVNVVIGTSGLSDGDYEDIDNEAKNRGVGVIAGGNFAISAALLLHFSTLAARYMRSWEIIDYASSGKIDAPSGMARELAYRLSKVRQSMIEIPINEVKGLKDARGATLNHNQVHSVRLPGFVIGAEVVFGNPDDRLTIRYDAGSGAESYVEGTLLAVRKIQGLKGLIRGLDRLLSL